MFDMKARLLWLTVVISPAALSLPAVPPTFLESGNGVEVRGIGPNFIWSYGGLELAGYAVNKVTGYVSDTLLACANNAAAGTDTCLEDAIASMTAFALIKLQTDLGSLLITSVIQHTATYASTEEGTSAMARRSTCPYSGDWNLPGNLDFNNGYGVGLTSQKGCSSTVWDSSHAETAAILSEYLATYASQTGVNEMQYTIYDPSSGGVLLRNHLYIGYNPTTCPVDPTGSGCNF